MLCVTEFQDHAGDQPVRQWLRLGDRLPDAELRFREYSLSNAGSASALRQCQEIGRLPGHKERISRCNGVVPGGRLPEFDLF